MKREASLELGVWWLVWGGGARSQTEITYLNVYNGEMQKLPYYRARLCTMPEQFNRVRLQMRHGHRMPHTVGYLLALPGPHSIIAQNPIYIIPVTTLRNLITFNHRTTHTITFFSDIFHTLL